MSSLTTAYRSGLLQDRSYLWTASSLSQLVVAGLIAACILFPPIHVTSQLWIRPEQVAISFVSLIYLWWLLAARARPIAFNPMLVVGPALCVIALLSTWYGSEFLKHRVIDRDFLELPKSLLPVAFFTVAYEAELSDTAMRRVFDVFGGAVLLVCSYAWCQWMNLGFTQKLNAYYSALNHDDALYYARRVYSTVGNPNILGQLMCWSFLVFFVLFLFRIGGARSLLVLLASMVTMTMTGSRYALLTTALGLVLIFTVKPKSAALAARSRIVFFAIVPAIVLASALVALSNTRTLNRFLTLERPLQTDSFRGRLDALWVQPWQDFLESPYLGHGPEKSAYTGIITDSEFLDIARKFGLFGFAAYLAYFLAPIWLIRRGLVSERHCEFLTETYTPANAAMVRAGLVMAVTALTMNVGMSTLTNLSVQGFLWIWLGLASAAGRTSLRLRTVLAQGVMSSCAYRSDHHHSE